LPLGMTTTSQVSLGVEFFTRFPCVNKLLIEERPVDAPQFQRPIVRAAEHNRWARCIACGGTRFSGIKRTRSDGEKPRYYACDGCVDTPDRVMMGGRAP
jgi:hypothetical protein